MTTVADKKGELRTVSLLEAEPNIVTEIKNKKRDGYTALQLGYPLKRKPKKPEQGHLKKSKLKSAKLLEFRIEDNSAKENKIGEKMEITVFKEGERVLVQGISRGLGFQGVIKRHGFSRGPESHGSNHHRLTGAIGQCAFPARVFKGKKMPGHTGARKTTIKNLEVIKIVPEKNLLAVKGSVPGKKGSFIVVKGG